MSFFNKIFMTKSEVHELSSNKLPSQYQIGEAVGVLMDNDLGNPDQEAEIVQGVIVSIIFDIGQVRYGIAFPIVGSEIYVVAQYLLANMVSLKNGSSVFCSASDITHILKNNSDNLE